jgi:hypothetical protein
VQIVAGNSCAGYFRALTIFYIVLLLLSYKKLSLGSRGVKTLGLETGEYAPHYALILYFQWRLCSLKTINVMLDFFFVKLK